MPNIENIELHNIDLRDPFFASIRADYIEFDAWFEKTCRDSTKHGAWACFEEEALGALLIYKREKNERLSDSTFIQGEILKICTFKVGEKIRGKKIGELLLKMAFKYASEKHLETIYVTAREEKQPHLLDLFQSFGFFQHGSHNSDKAYIKKHPVIAPQCQLKPVDYCKQYYPKFKYAPDINIYIVPIRPKFHQILFPDSNLNPQDLFPSPAGNAIRRAYLCNSKIKNINPGDILLFYRSKDIQSITTIGIVEKSQISDNAEEITTQVAKRSIYSYKDIIEMASKRTRVILFLTAIHLVNLVDYKWLLDENIIRGQIQTIRRINNAAFRRIAEKGSFTNCFYAD